MFGKPSLKCFVAFTLAILIGILFLGLRPKGQNFSNNADWIAAPPGIRFGKYGIAYTDPAVEYVASDVSDPNGFSIDMAIKPLDYHEYGFNLILLFHNGEDRRQLLVGQWRSWIIIMNGDDYAHKRKTKRLSVNVDSESPKTRFVTITTGKEGTRVYVDGRLARTNEALHLNIPSEPQARLVLGNSVYGRHPWRGDIFGLALYGRVLSAQDAALHYQTWSTAQNFEFAEKAGPFILYLFNEKQGSQALDHAGGNHHLNIPSRMRILKREILSTELNGGKFNRSFIQDMAVNLAGFIPFGFFLAGTLMKLGRGYEKHSALITMAMCFSVSLSIEIVQAWMPSRSSQMLDLMLNTFGALIGTVIYRIFNRQVKFTAN